MKYIIIVIVIVWGLWLLHSDNQDTQRGIRFNYCQEQYRANALGVEYIEAMQECMN